MWRCTVYKPIRLRFECMEYEKSLVFCLMIHMLEPEHGNVEVIKN